jgi:hypothetical protein
MPRSEQGFSGFEYLFAKRLLTNNMYNYQKSWFSIIDRIKSEEAPK